MDVENKTSQSWGGDWTEIKLQAFEDYVKAYLKIMNSQKKNRAGWPITIYFDGFAGSGDRGIERNNDQSFFFDDVSAKELSVYKGSAERVLGMQIKFDKYYFVDNSNNSLNDLRTNLKMKNLLTDSCNFIYNDMNAEIKKFSSELNEQMAALVFLDPFGMQINWDSIETLRDKRVDLWILIPSGVIVNRLLDNSGELIFQEKLESFFGLPIEEIRQIFYEEKKEKTLFGEEEQITKVGDSIAKIAEIYIRNLKKIFLYVTENPLLLKNSKNVTIYHFVFASNNKTAYKIASQIIGKKQK